MSEPSTHNRTSSIESTSTVSSLTSVSSVSSVSSETSLILYNSVKGQADDASVKSDSLDGLVLKAQKAIELFASHEKSKLVNPSINLDQVMAAMLDHADHAGGDDGKRYVASTILKCKDDPERLAAVGYTWLTHLLWIFKSSRSHSTQSNADPSPIATPTLDRTTGLASEGAGNRAKAFKDDLLLRDGYTCVVSKVRDFNHPNRDPNMLFGADLVGAHIFRRAVAVYNDDLRSKNSIAAFATLDILKNFTRITEAQLADLSNLIDEPSNGMLLESNLHSTFDKFYWCLHKIGDDTYKIKILNGSRIPFILQQVDLNAPIVFRDRSVDLNDLPAKSLKRSRSGFDLPDENLIAIHAAIGGILHMSGAGKFFDELLDRYQDGDSPAPLLSWMDLETLIKTKEMREGLAFSMTTVSVGA